MSEKNHAAAAIVPACTTPLGVSISPSSSFICNPGGSPVSLTASGSGIVSFAWSPAIGLSAITGTSVNANPAVTTVYTVTGTDAFGCSGTANATVTVALKPTVAPTATPAAICAGTNSALNANASMPAITYCTPVYSNGTSLGNYISLVQITGTTLNNATLGAPTPFYTLFPASGSTTAILTAGTGYSLSVRGGTFIDCYIRGWIDYNGDGQFSASESIGISPNVGNSVTGSFGFSINPLMGLNGVTRLRLRSGNLPPGPGINEFCGATNSNYGETEDYVILITGASDAFTYLWTPNTFLSGTITANTTATAMAVTTGYTVQVTASNGCSAAGSVNVTVNPLPTVSYTGLNTAYCVNAAAATLTGSPSGGVFSGPGISGNTFNPATAGAGGPYTITYTYTNGNGCTNTNTKTVTVNALPTVSYTGLNTAYCVNAAAATLTGSPSGGVFSGPGISGNTFNPATAGAGGPYTITYTYNSGNGCTRSTTKTVTVNALPTVNYSGLNTAYCVNAAAATLTGSPSGGVFSGPGISANTFNPATAGAGGPYTITYTYTNGNGCTRSITKTVTVNALPTASYTGLNTAYCVNAAAATLTGSPSGGVFSGPGISANTFNPATAGAGGPYTITYTYTNGNGCTNTTTKTVTVNALPTVSYTGLNTAYCVNAAAATLTASPSGGIFSGPGISANTFNPATAGAGGPYTITYTYANVNGCVNASTKQVTVTACDTTITLNLKLFLQGYYVGSSTMQPVLNNQAVLSSLATEVDTIRVSLHHPTTFAMVDSKKAVLLTNGTVSVNFTQNGGSYYIGIRHRNSVETWSAGAVACTASTPLYDFSTAANKAFADNQVLVQPGVWAFYTGDVNQDELIDGNDFPGYDTDSFNGVNSVYRSTDINGDGFVDGNDFPIYDTNSFNGKSSIHP